MLNFIIFKVLKEVLISYLVHIAFSISCRFLRILKRLMFIVYAYDVKIKKNEKFIPKGEIANSCILKWKKLAFLCHLLFS